MENKKEAFKIGYTYPKEDVPDSVWKVDHEEYLG